MNTPEKNVCCNLCKGTGKLPGEEIQLSDRADGCAGHFCISRFNSDKNCTEFLTKDWKWAGFGDVLVGREKAEEMLEAYKNSVWYDLKLGQEVYENSVGGHILRVPGGWVIDRKVFIPYHPKPIW